MTNTDWKYDGVRVVRAGELDGNTPQTPGMDRAAAITHAKVGASKIPSTCALPNPVRYVSYSVDFTVRGNRP